MRVFAALALAALAGWGGFQYGRRRAQPPETGRKILYYHDPMHPAYKSDKPGIAPDCGMKLEPVYADEGPAAERPAGERKVLYYRDPKAPNYKADKPGLNPETGNDLEPVYAGEPSAMPPGTVQISPEKQQLIGVKFGTVEMASAGRDIRAAGKVAWDETRVARVHTKVEGWIDQVFVDFVGELVEKGRPLLTLYSPELLATQQEYLLALRSREVLHHSTMPGVTDYSRSLMEAARRRLELFDLTPAQIDEIARENRPRKNITVFAPIAGYVTNRNAFPNQRILPDTELYTLVDLSRVWVVADVFEYEAPHVAVGQAVTVVLPLLGGRRVAGRIGYIQPQVDPMTRTLKVRVELDNPGMALKPEMFAEVELRVASGSRLSVPAEAVLDSGRVKTVFVDRGNGFFEPRRVQTGERMGDRVEIVSGLKAGERIVVSGNFLIDSESQLKAAAAGMRHDHD